MKVDRIQAAGVLYLAGFRDFFLFEIPNEYHPDDAKYDKIRKEQPWWICSTPIFGDIYIKSRYNVISVEWELRSPTIDFRVTKDNVTQSHTFVHADSIEKVMEYLTSLRAHIKTW